MKYSLTLTDLEHTPDLLQESAWMEICSWKRAKISVGLVQESLQKYILLKKVQYKYKYTIFHVHKHTHKKSTCINTLS